VRTCRRGCIRCVVLVLVACVVGAAGCAHGGFREQALIDRFAMGFVGTLSQDDKDAFANARKGDLPMFHFGAGSRIRELYFGPTGDGRKAFCRPDHFCDIDRESMRIVERTWEIIHGAG
jgi:hypothetical protein